MSEARPATPHEIHQPVGGSLWTRPFQVLLILAGLGFVLIAWRFFVGLGPSTGLSDGYPWGLWIAFDVVTGTALACGGYAVAILVYAFNQGRYHALVRPAILTSALGYTLAGLAIAIDVGRPWLIYRVPISVGKYNLNSALLEVALCVMAYVVVLWIELAPAFLEKWKESERDGLRRFAQKTLPVLDKALLFIIALGVLLPTMHQSSLGTVMLLAGPRLHPLWNTALVPLLFLISCLAMGYAVVVMESTLSSRVWGRKRETAMLATLSRAMIVVLGLFFLLRLGDLIWRGELGLVFRFDVYAWAFLVEMALVAVAIGLLLRKDRLRNAGYLFQAALVIVLAGTLYRFSTYLLAFNPGSHWSYFPTIPEILITIGLVSAEVLVYIVLVKRFPILAGGVAARQSTRVLTERS